VRAPSRRVRVDIELAQARYVRADRIRILVGGAVDRTEPVPAGARRHRVTLEVDVTAPTWIGVDAGGDEPLPVWMTGTYQIEKGRPGVVPFAIINPIERGAVSDGRATRVATARPGRPGGVAAACLVGLAVGARGPIGDGLAAAARRARAGGGGDRWWSARGGCAAGPGACWPGRRGAGSSPAR
jgi:hypothetical protein